MSELQRLAPETMFSSSSEVNHGDQRQGCDIGGQEKRMDKSLMDLSRTLQQGGDRPEMARKFAEAIRAAGPYRWCGIYDVDLQKGIVSNIAWSGADAPAHPVFPITNGLTSRAIADKRTVNVGDVANDPDYLTALTTTRSEIIIPVLDAAGERVVGTIDVESDRPDAFDSAAQDGLEKCATALRGFWS
jgi:putative methionine-R-sulfoxide reductase with GAF domain